MHQNCTPDPARIQKIPQSRYDLSRLSSMRSIAGAGIPMVCKYLCRSWLHSFTGHCSRGTASVGIDPGRKDFVTISDGTQIEAKRFDRDAETKLTVAQRTQKKSRVKAVHAKIVDCRKDFLYKLNAELVSKNCASFVSHENACGLWRTLASTMIDFIRNTSFDAQAVLARTLVIETVPKAFHALKSGCRRDHVVVFVEKRCRALSLIIDYYDVSTCIFCRI